MAVAYDRRGQFSDPIPLHDREEPIPTRPPPEVKVHGWVSRRRVRTRHASYVLATLVVLGVLLLGCYEALAAYVNPSASLFAGPNAPDVPGTWLQVSSPTAVYWPDDTQAWLARPGERYQVVHQEPGWALAIRQGDAAAHQVWLPLNERGQTR
jgi:hypothetical protein